MKLNLGRTVDERTEYLQAWHPWFAWRPVSVGRGDWRWLETIERRGRYWFGFTRGGWDWYYRLPGTVGPDVPPSRNQNLPLPLPKNAKTGGH